MQNRTKLNDSVPFTLKKPMSGLSKVTWTFLAGAWLLELFAPTPPQVTAPCVPHSQPFYGYTFFDADFVDASAAYAPFFLRFGDYYERNYNPELIQQKENCEEWSERFCSKARWEEVAEVIYDSDAFDLAQLHEAASDPTRKTPLPTRLENNDFAYVVAYNGCSEVTRYLTYAKRCEEHVVARGDGWSPAQRHVPDMLELIREGKERFYDTQSAFVRLRYLFQIVRLAHYAGEYQMTVDLYDELMPKVDRKKRSEIFYWALGHLAGAMQKLGKYPEAAYRYSIIFRHCPSKRTQAFRSFKIRNDKDWQETLKLCHSNEERSTLYIMRAGGSHTWAAADMEAIYEMDPSNPQLELLLVSDVQELEKVLLRTNVTDHKNGRALAKIKREAVTKHLLDLQKLVRRVIREAKVANPKVWRAVDGYLELLANDRYAAAKTWDRQETELENNKQDNNIFQQLEIWRCLLSIMNLDTTASDTVDRLSYKVRSLDAFDQNPYFEPFLQEWLSAGYAQNNHPGKAMLAAYPPHTMRFNPRLDVLEDLLRSANSFDPILLERTMMIDTNPEQIKAYILETKGVYFLSRGEPEAAAAIFRQINPIEQSRMTQFVPFANRFGEKINREPPRETALNRLEITEQLIAFEQEAKAAHALQDTNEAKIWLRLGDFWYNTSFFGYEWEVRDFHRDGANQTRLSQGPVFPLEGAPDGNRENLDLDLALEYYEKAYLAARTQEMKARAAFMAARVRQKQWFCHPDCTYRPGNSSIPLLPPEYMAYYNLLITRHSKTRYFETVVKECKWLAAYAR
ncbi:MAG: hypothetical protein IT261_00845 [Saprospiraceae bacterium]|nr:hypothetical protein [Saprospiraceae bacterium]